MNIMRKILLLFLIVTCHFAIGQALNRNTPPLEEIVRKHAPMIWHAADEIYLPSSVEWFFDRAVLMKNRDNGDPKANDVLCHLSDPNCQARLSDPSQGKAYAITNESPERNRLKELYRMHRIESSAKFGDITSAKAYVNIRLAHYQPFPRFEYYLEIQYWLFYPYNGSQDPLNLSSHEGDWEGVSIIVDQYGDFKYAISTEHGDRNFYQKSQLEFREGTHPVLYSAKDSHALYNTPGCHQTIYGSFGDYDCIEPWEGVKQFKTWNSFEIIEIDPRIEAIGTTPTNPHWKYFGGLWGDTYDEESLGISGTNSPAFVRRDSLEWTGVYFAPVTINSLLGPITIQYPFPHDYTLRNLNSSGRPQREAANKISEPTNYVSGASSLCSGNNYSYHVNINKNKSVSWSAPASNFSPATSQSQSFTTKASSYGNGKKIQAITKLEHKIGGNSAYKTTHTFSKNVAVRNAANSGLTLSIVYLEEGNSNCQSQIRLNNNSGMYISSVNWSVTPTLGHSTGSLLTLGYNNNSYAYISSDGEASGMVTATVMFCGEPIEISALVAHTCSNSGSGPFREQEILGFGFSSGTDFSEVEGQIYPNPTSGAFRIMVEDGVEFSNVRAIISDQSGRTIREVQVPAFKSFLDLDISNEENGIYIISAFSNDKQIFKGKLVKK